MARAKRNRRIGVVVSALLVAAVVAFVITRPSTSVASPEELLSRATQAKEAAGCGPVEDVGPFQPRERDRAHLATAAGAPPLSDVPLGAAGVGPARPGPARATGVYDTPPPIFRRDPLARARRRHRLVLAGRERPGAGGPEGVLSQTSSVGARVIVAPYDYPDGGGGGTAPRRDRRWRSWRGTTSSAVPG